MIELLDAMSELVYVVDVDTYELLYMNASGREHFGIDRLDGLKCYSALQGYCAPCSFCTTPCLREDRYYTWERDNPITGRHYLLKDKLLDWEGKRGRIEIAFDLTEKQELLRAEELVVDCVETLQLGGALADTANRTLSRLAEFAGARRAYLLELEGGRAAWVYEWTAPDAASCAFKLQGMDLCGDGWRELWGPGARVLAYPDLRKDKNEARPAAAHAGPEAGGIALDCAQVSAALVLIDPRPDREAHLPAVLKALVGFVTSIIQKERYQQHLELLSYRDALTGVQNRNAYIRDIEREGEAGQAMGIAHLNVNGTKSLNDRYGRKHGDQVLRHTAHKLQRILVGATVYRVGGDEFIALWNGADAGEFDYAIRRLKEWQQEEKETSFALGYQWTGCCGNLRALAAEAEERMYRDKMRCYRGEAISRRYRPVHDQVLFLGDEEKLEWMLKERRFCIYYQPKFSAEDGEQIGAEALVRCQSPEGELIPPDQFIPFLEQARLISRVDFYVFESVCAHCALA